MPKAEPAITRFWRHVSAQDDGCWTWTAARKNNGYGAFKYDHHTMGYAHRFAYEHFVGQIPEGKEIDHLCRNRACCNPGHLETVTRKENLRRSPITMPTIHAAKTHCKQGHAFTSDNTWVEKNGARHCKRCHADREALRRAEGIA